MNDDKLLAYAKRFRHSIIAENSSDRMCFAISAPLCAALNTLGMKFTLVESDLGECNHIFLQFPDGRVLDPTVDQFNWISRENMPGVYMGHPLTIHADATPLEHDGIWDDLMRELSKLEPDMEAEEAGLLVRKILATL